MSRRQKHPDVQREVEDTVYTALQAEGRMVPLTPEEVAEAEKHLWEWSPNPDESEPPSFDEVAKPREAAAFSLLTDSDDSIEIEETLARAARMGGEITPEIEAAMQRDRDAAERESE